MADKEQFEDELNPMMLNLIDYEESIVIGHCIMGEEWMIEISS